MRTQTQILNDVLQNQHYATYLNEQVLDIQEHGNKLLRSINNWQKSKTIVYSHKRKHLFSFMVISIQKISVIQCDYGYFLHIS